MGEEKCEDCGKIISKRAIANVHDGKVVCTACKKKLVREAEWREREKEQAAEEEARRKLPATERQKEYANSLGLTYPKNISMGDMSALLDKVEDEKRKQQAKHQLRAWVFSVMRHARGADWILWKDSGVGVREVDKVVTRIQKLPEVIGQIRAFDGPDYDDAEMDRGFERDLDEPDEWYHFNGGDEADDTSDAYSRTLAMVREVLGNALDSAPARVAPKPVRGGPAVMNKAKPTGCLGVAMLGVSAIGALAYHWLG